MISRLATIGLVCAGLYAATLGAGAFAQDESTPADPTPAATETAPAPPPATPEPTVDEQPTPFPSPVETVVPPTPEPTQDATPAPTKTAAPAQTPEKTQEPKQTATPDATATPGASPSPAATPGAKQEKRRKTSPNRSEGVAGLDDSCDEGKLVGSVVTGKASTSTSGRDCVKVDDKKSDQSDKESGDEHGDSPLGGDTPAPAYNTDGSPTTSNPGYTLATPGAAPIGVPNFFIEKFRIPPFLLPIYQAAGIQYGIRWEVLAAINEDRKSTRLNSSH